MAEGRKTSALQGRAFGVRLVCTSVLFGDCAPGALGAALRRALAAGAGASYPSRSCSRPIFPKGNRLLAAATFLSAAARSCSAARNKISLELPYARSEPGGSDAKHRWSGRSGRASKSFPPAGGNSITTAVIPYCQLRAELRGASMQFRAPQSGSNLAERIPKDTSFGGFLSHFCAVQKWPAGGEQPPIYR